MLKEKTKWKALAEYLEGGNLPAKSYLKIIPHQFVVKDEILYYVKEKSDGSLHYCLVVPQSLKNKAMAHAHINSGHLGQKTILKAEELYYWNNLKVDIRNYVKNRVTCQRFKGQKGLQQQQQEMPPVENPLKRAGIDLTDMVAGDQNYRYVLPVIDHYSRYVKFFPLKHKHTHTHTHTHCGGGSGPVCGRLWSTPGPSSKQQMRVPIPVVPDLLPVAPHQGLLHHALQSPWKWDHRTHAPLPEESYLPYAKDIPFNGPGILQHAKSY